MNYQTVHRFLSKAFLSQTDGILFREYIRNILENKQNIYGVLVIPGNRTGDALIHILRTSLGKYYNVNRRNSEERLIRHNDIGKKALKIIKENQHCHHVYNWREDVSEVITIYESNKIIYTLCNINDNLEEAENIIHYMPRDSVKDLIKAILSVNY